MLITGRRIVLLVAAFAGTGLHPRQAYAQSCIYISAGDGKDSNDGTSAAPFKTLARAKQQVQAMKTAAAGPITVFLRAGTYYLDSTLAFGPEDGGTAGAPITYSSYLGEKAVISGGYRITGTWTSATGPGGQAIMKTTLAPNLKFDQLFLNGKRQILARYPNYDANAILQGNASDAQSKALATANPAEGPCEIRGIHNSGWGGNSYVVVKNGSSYSASWVGDNQRGSGMGEKMAENCYEFLDAPGEWYYKKPTGDLFFYPPTGTDLSSAVIEGASLESLLRIKGTSAAKVKHLAFNGLTFTQTYRTLFSSVYKFEPLLRSDWSVVRMGAIFMQDAENVTIKHCAFDQLGGNGIFMNGYNRNHLIFNNEFTDVGATCVQTVGLESAVRNPSTWSKNATLTDRNPGPLTDEYPKEIAVDNNLMVNFGVFEKQTSAVNISASSRISVTHNRMTICPRAAINVCDGTWGGHDIAFNDADSCTRETQDHGPFNSWGRDRWWATNNQTRDIMLLDVVEPIKLHNNRFKSVNKDGWPAIDLDDGSSNYLVYDNLCLQNGIKFREGFLRRGYNNIIVVGRQGCHAWVQNCYDSIYHNIIVPSPLFTGNGGANAYDVAGMTLSASNHAYIDSNLFWNNGGSVNYAPTKGAGMDQHSLVADPGFKNPTAGDYTVAAGSPALALGFANFPLDSIGRRSVKIDTLGKSCPAGTFVRARPAPDGSISFRNGRVEVRYFLAEISPVEIDLLSVSGKIMASPKRGIEPAGEHLLSWSPGRLAGASAYLLRVRFGANVMVKKVISEL